MSEKLFKMKPQEYGGLYQEHLFKQYELYLEHIQKITEFRHSANNYFLTINTVLISLLSISFKSEFAVTCTWIKPVISFVGIIFCVIFWFLIHAYKQLNTAKFKVLKEIEEKLPLYLYRYEWLILDEGKNWKTYLPFSHIELFVPWVFGVVYLFLGIVFLVKL